MDCKPKSYLMPNPFVLGGRSQPVGSLPKMRRHAAKNQAMRMVRCLDPIYTGVNIHVTEVSPRREMKFQNERATTQRFPHNPSIPFIEVKVGFSTTSKHFPHLTGARH